MARLWNAETGEVIREFSGHGSEVSAARFMPDEQSVMTASHDGQARLFEISTGRLVRTFAGHEGGLSDIAITRDGTRLLTAASEDQAKVWDIQTGRELIALWNRQTENLRGFALSPSEDRLIPQGYRSQIEIGEAILWSELSRIGGPSASMDQRLWDWQKRNHEFLQKIAKP
jgi:WD40 repeat protein